MKKSARFLIVLCLGLLLVACAKSDGAASAVETYFQAIVTGDTDAVTKISCPDWKSTAQDEIAAFAGVKARLDKFSCKTTATQGDKATVECSGGIIATYVDREQTIDLSERQYDVVKQGNQWLMCGYGQ